MGDAPSIIIAVLAHNEAALIGDCLRSLPLGEPGFAVHVVVNGSRDDTAARARAFPGVTVHEYAEGGKSRSWNRFVFEELTGFAGTHIFADGDARVEPGSIAALVKALADNPGANAASALPLNGRRAAAYRATTIRDHGLFGDLYAVRGSFLQRMKAAGISLPSDLIGDDGLIGALAKTDLGPNAVWSNARVVPVEEAGFYMGRPADAADIATWPMQYRRMINYSMRHFQNRIVSAIMAAAGPKGLPRNLASLYPEWLPRFRPRQSPRWWWFDRQALARMRAASARDR